MRRIITTFALTLGISVAFAQPMQLAPNSDETFQRFTESVPVAGSPPGVASTVAVDLFVSQTGDVASLTMSTGDCRCVQISPTQWLCVGAGCRGGGGQPPPLSPILSPLLVEVNVSKPSVTMSTDKPSVAITVQSIDVSGLQEGQKFELTPPKQ